MIYGTLQQRSWENQDGDRRSKVEIVADEVAPSLRWAAAQITRNEFKGASAGGGGATSGGGAGGSGASQGGDGQAAANQPPAYDMDEEPF